MIKRYQAELWLATRQGSFRGAIRKFRTLASARRCARSWLADRTVFETRGGRREPRDYVDIRDLKRKSLSSYANGAEIESISAAVMIVGGLR